MVVPDSDRPVRSFRMKLFAAFFFAAVVTMVLVSFVFLITAAPDTGILARGAELELRDAEASLEQVREEIISFLDVYDEFNAALTDTVSRVRSEERLASDREPPADLASMLGASETGRVGAGEVELLEHAIGSLRNSLGSLERLADVVELHEELVSDLPTLWPLINGLGQVTMEFGPNLHPILRSWYMHRGFDIWYYTGTPIVAAGNGTVVEAGYDAISGFGWNVEIEHPYGFSSKYTHMSRIDVREGDEVVQGQRIGALGASGTVTGPHLHFEVKLGTELIDPAYFLRLSKPNFNRRVLERF